MVSFRHLQRTPVCKPTLTWTGLLEQGILTSFATFKRSLEKSITRLSCTPTGSIVFIKTCRNVHAQWAWAKARGASWLNVGSPAARGNKMTVHNHTTYSLRQGKTNWLFSPQIQDAAQGWLSRGWRILAWSCRRAKLFAIHTNLLALLLRTVQSWQGQRSNPEPYQNHP